MLDVQHSHNFLQVIKPNYYIWRDSALLYMSERGSRFLCLHFICAFREMITGKKWPSRVLPSNGCHSNLSGLNYYLGL